MAALADDVRDQAFERLYEGHVGDVYRYVLAVLRNPADAEDVTQTTFMNAYRAFKAGERPRKPQNWLITIAHNACRTRAVRASRRPREVPLDDVINQLAVPEQDKPNVRELLGALGRLPFNQRAAITMRELEGRTYGEIADTLGVTVPAVEALIVRARRTMRMQGSALRGLAVVQLPRSLRGMFESGDAATAGGALLGGGVLAKAVAIVVAGVVAGGIGKTVDASVVHRTHSTPRLEPRAHTMPATASHGAHGSATRSVHRDAVAGRGRHARTVRAVATPGPTISVVVPGRATSPTVDGGLPLVPAPSPPSAREAGADPGAAPPVSPTVTSTVSSTVDTLLPPPPVPAPALPVPVPAPDLPPVMLPVAPPAVAAPVLPPLPALPTP
jgi:RNA polymerase sigma factor (sigma-70 family)